MQSAAQELVYTAKPLMHNVVEVDLNWLQTCRSRVHAVSPYRYEFLPAVVSCWHLR